MLKIYGIKNCDSVKKAIKFFKEHNIEYEFIDFKTKNIGCEKINFWLNHSDIKTLLNSRGTTYKTLKIKELNLDENAKKEYMCKYNMLIKRPVVEYKNQLIIGFNLSNYEGVFL